MSERRHPTAGKPRIRMGLFTLVLGVIGWFASFQLLTEYIRVLVQPEYSPNCNISVLVTCGPNMSSWQGSIFGFPNPIIGVSAFVIPIVIGVAMMVGSVFPRWFWSLYQLGLLAGFVFVHWLVYQSIFELNTLCPWCMVVWLVMIPLFWSTLFGNAAQGHYGRGRGIRRFGSGGLQWAWVIIVVNLVVIAAVAQFRMNWLFTEFGIGSF